MFDSLLTSPDTLKTGASALLSTSFLFAWVTPAVIAFCGLAAGLIIDFVLRRYVRQLTRKTRWEGDDEILKALAAKTPLWGLLAGILIALPFAPITPKLLTWLTRGFSALLILSMTHVIANQAAERAAASAVGMAGSSTTIFKVLTRIGVWGLGLAILMNQLGISVAPILTALGVGGLAVALALQDTLGNLFAGIQIILSKQVRVGDYIRLETGAEGYVVDINWRNTSIRELPNNMIVIPNSKLASTIVTNFYMPNIEMAVLVQVGVAYDSDLDRVEKIVIDVARKIQKDCKGAIHEFDPFIRYHTFGDNAVQFTVILRTGEYVGQHDLKHAFIKALHARFLAEGIKIPFPQRVITVKGAGDPKDIPPEQLLAD